MPRYVAFRSATPFSDEFVRTVGRNCKSWDDRIQAFLAANQDKGWIAASTYAVGALQRKGGANEIFVELGGSPSNALLRILEDCFPLHLLLNVPTAELHDLEVGYFNDGFGVSMWRSLTAEERESICTGEISNKVG